MKVDQNNKQLNNSVMVLDERVSRGFYQQTLLTGTLFLLIGVSVIYPLMALLLSPVMILIGLLVIAYSLSRILRIDRYLKNLLD